MAKAFILMRLDREDIAAVRTVLHAIGGVDDIPFYPDATGWYSHGATRDSDLAKYDKLRTVFETSLNYAKDRRRILVRKGRHRREE